MNQASSATARWAFLAHGPAAVGRVLLMEFAAGERAPVRSSEHRRVTGLCNLNFYTRNLAADYRDFRRNGAEFWSGPIHNVFGPVVGETVEVVFEGPDSIFVQGHHPFGKIALSQPINYETESLVPRATPPNIGYLAQSFEDSDLNTALRACAPLEESIFSAPADIDLPGRGRCASMLVRNPGSAALQEIFEAQ